MYHQILFLKYLSKVLKIDFAFYKNSEGGMFQNMYTIKGETDYQPRLDAWD